MDIKITMREIFDKGLDLSKKTYEKAKEFGEMGITQVEIVTMQHKMAKEIGKLGTIAYRHFSKEKTSLKKDARGVPTLVKKIYNIEQKIKLKENELKKKKAGK
ncbi:MAG: hypothetical protein WBK44_04135 [Smithellaceae bacterium]|jgi:Tfp pilus assembly PilM family ATPase|nr:hypothetical protein [Syntrophaceae bacterium]MDX9815590.1 hypothetical protein [Smithellaceae bacterium]NMD05909.1 hypothetical protein [Deltaproteobacteria bacterium]OPZ52669.1 MAG: hypothetical protein BWY90_01017 [Deltaproteobacteria bacterium ADurb.BinA014]MBP8608244.1 hypothetical protein [Syntrophaceae bacterium]